MSGFLRRQVAAKLALGEQTQIADAATFLWQIRDVLPKYILKLAAGKWSYGKDLLAQSGTAALPLPSDYDSANRLFVAVRATAYSKVTVVSPAHTTGSIMLMGTTGSTTGNHDGLAVFQERITSVTFAIPSTGQGGADTEIEWFFFEIPDLTDPDSWRDGDRALGVVS